MARLLAETVRRWASTPCAPLPCGLEVWRYCCELRGVDVTPLPPHETALQAAKLLKRHGGLAAYAGSLIEPLGWQPLRQAEPLQRGDVGVISIPAMGETCALFLGPRWAAKGDRSVLIVNGDRLAAWRLPSCLKHSPGLS